MRSIDLCLAFLLVMMTLSNTNAATTSSESPPPRRSLPSRRLLSSPPPPSPLQPSPSPVPVAVSSTTPTASTGTTNGTDNVTLSGNYEYIGKSNIVAVHLVAVPDTNRFFFMERPSGHHPDGSNVIAGFFDMDTGNFTNVKDTDSLFCAGHTLLPDGNIVVVGGHIAKAGYADGLKSIRIFDRHKNTLTTIAKMRYQRWYPTATLLPSGKVLIMGGTLTPASKKKNPNYELWDPAYPDITSEIALPPVFVEKTENVYYPFNFILPSGHLFSYCTKYGHIIDPTVTSGNASVISVVPSHHEVAMTVSLEYPFSATSVMLALLPENNYSTELMFFGGQYNYGWINDSAVPTSLRLKVNYDSSNNSYSYERWVKEEMGSPRVMGDSVLLPNGYVIILNGAKVGVAGDDHYRANEPNMHALMYNPNAPVGSRYTPLAKSQIPRLYHSTAALTADGTILVTGCDRCNFFTSAENYTQSPTGLPEYRMEIFYPPFYYNIDRPMITFAQSNITYGGSITVGYDTYSGNGVSGAVLVAPSSCTHSFNTHQRVVGLVIASDDHDGHLILTGPPNANVAPPGKYLLFLLNGDSYSTAAWVLLA